MGPAMPLVVTGAFATNFVAAVSVANVAGRLGWSSLSDYLGPQRVVNILGVAAPICATVPTACIMAASDPGYLPLGLFCGGTLGIVANFGGWFSVLPSYIATIFGPQHAGAIMGRLLTGYSAAAIAGPTLLMQLRGMSTTEGIESLARVCDPALFQTKFGVPIESLPALIEANSITIAQLMEISPAGTMDPTITLYNTTLYTMSGVLASAIVCNNLVKPAITQVIQPSTSTIASKYQHHWSNDPYQMS